MKIIFLILLLVFLNFDLYSFGNIDKNLRSFNKTQTASVLKAVFCLGCSFSAGSSALAYAKVTIRDLKNGECACAFNNSVISASTLYCSYFLLNHSLRYIKHVLDIR